MDAIARWRERAGIRKGPLFRRVETHFDGSVAAIGTERLHPNSITLIYRRVIRAAWAKKLLGPISEAELERWVSAVSSHSIRSEEHTSELQSLMRISYAVFCLKQKNKQQKNETKRT